MSILRHPFCFLAVSLLTLCYLGGRFGPVGAGFLTLWPGEGDAAGLVLPAGRFMLLYAFTWAASLLLFFFFPRRLSARRKTFLIFGLAVAVRLLLLTHPVGDDIYRYLWEGRVFLSRQNPYLLAPDAAQLQALAAADPYHALINHPDLSAIYPPAMILLFAGVGRLWYHFLAVKLTVVLFDLGTLGLLMLLLARRELPARYALLYAVNPVILYSFAGQGHMDSLQSFFLLAALVAHDRRRWGWMWLFGGIAVQVKYMAVVALPFLVKRANRRWGWVALAAAGLPFLPFGATCQGLFTEGLFTEGLFATLIHFGRDFGVGGPIHGLLRLLTGAVSTASMLTLALAVVLLCGLTLFFHCRRTHHGDRRPERGVYLALGSLLLCLPTVHFWYLSWILPFVALYYSNAWLLLSLTAATYFSAEGQMFLTGQWALTWPYQLIQWLPFGLLFIPELIRGVRHLCVPMVTDPVASVSVIIPTRNEAAAIGACVDAARVDPVVCEVLVVDAGSRDVTATLAREAGARVIDHQHPPAAGGGRGGQVARGLDAARGDVVAIVHADTRVAKGSFSRMCRLLNLNPDMVGGALGTRFETGRLFYRFLTAANDIRALVVGISFGDQIQYFRRRAFLGRSAYPDLPLMEDVELSLRMRRCGRQGYLFGRSSVSVRRWQQAGAGHIWTVVRLFSRYLWQRGRGRADAAAYFHSYYGRLSERNSSKNSVLKTASTGRDT
jgi:GT2 family glycosyltransferase